MSTYVHPAEKVHVKTRVKKARAQQSKETPLLSTYGANGSNKEQPKQNDDAIYRYHRRYCRESAFV